MAGEERFTCKLEMQGLAVWSPNLTCLNFAASSETMLILWFGGTIELRKAFIKLGFLKFLVTLWNYGKL
jgi:hypothetical protein